MFKKLTLFVCMAGTALGTWPWGGDASRAAMETGNADEAGFLDPVSLAEMGISAEEIEQDPSCLDWVKERARSVNGQHFRYVKIAGIASVISGATHAASVMAEGPTSISITLGIALLSTLFNQNMRFIFSDMSWKVKYPVTFVMTVAGYAFDVYISPWGLGHIGLACLTACAKGDDKKPIKKARKDKKKKEKNKKPLDIAEVKRMFATPEFLKAFGETFKAELSNAIKEGGLRERLLAGSENVSSADSAYFSSEVV